MAVLTVHQTTIGGAEKPTLVAASAAGDRFRNDGKTIVHVNNGGGAGITVTITGQRTLPGGISSNKDVVVPAGQEFLFGPFPAGIYNTDGAQEVVLAYSDVTSVTVGAISASDKYN